MSLQVLKTHLEAIRHLRVLFLQQNRIQFVHNKCHVYGWADQYLFLMDDKEIGYGAAWGREHREERDTIFEFYLLEPFRDHAGFVFSQFLSEARPRWIECQTNDPLLSSMLFEYADNIHAEAILFRDFHETDFNIPGTRFQKGPEKNENPSDSGEYIVQHNDETVATGGFMLNYNLPYADIYMEVKEPHRKKGFGGFIIQELKKQIYLIDRVPAARCSVDNLASKSTLLKSGFIQCGLLIYGELKAK
jgi:hypothetical protein